MRFAPPLRRGILIRRYKRFLADIETTAGKPLTIHCPNTGGMLGCADPGSMIWYSTSDNPRRKYRHTLEIVRNADGDLIGVNTARANALVAEALSAGLVLGMPAGTSVRREVAIPEDGGRFDLLAGDVFMEVKSVTLLLDGAGSGAFPDAVSIRATRHVEALARLARAGTRTALVFCVQHTGIETVRPADDIDPAYGQALRRAVGDGVQVAALRCRITPQEIVPAGLLPVMVGSDA